MLTRGQSHTAATVHYHNTELIWAGCAAFNLPF